jgi:hypothetical protein
MTSRKSTLFTYQFPIIFHKAQTFILINIIPSILHSLGPIQTPIQWVPGRKVSADLISMFPRLRMHCRGRFNTLLRPLHEHIRGPYLGLVLKLQYIRSNDSNRYPYDTKCSITYRACRKIECRTNCDSLEPALHGAVS